MEYLNLLLLLAWSCSASTLREIVATEASSVVHSHTKEHTYLPYKKISGEETDSKQYTLLTNSGLGVSETAKKKYASEELLDNTTWQQRIAHYHKAPPQELTWPKVVASENLLRSLVSLPILISATINLCALGYLLSNFFDLIHRLLSLQAYRSHFNDIKPENVPNVGFA